MNKKVICIFLMIICILSTLAISVWGKVPEDSSRISVDKITILDPSKEDQQCETNINGRKIIKLPMNDDTYQLTILINPDDATDQTVDYKIYQGEGNATIDDNGLITFINKSPISVRVSCIQDGRIDEVYIEFDGTIDSTTEDNPF